jgi:hypothetical protein
VSYTPDVAEVVKDAWIQYLAMLVVVAFLIDRFSSFVYFNQVGGGIVTCRLVPVQGGEDTSVVHGSIRRGQTVLPITTRRVVMVMRGADEEDMP